MAVFCLNSNSLSDESFFLNVLGPHSLLFLNKNNIFQNLVVSDRCFESRQDFLFH